jgi:hypothetical protein
MKCPDFLMNHLQMKNGWKLFEDALVDEKRVKLKRLVLAMMKNNFQGENLGDEYRAWRDDKFTYGRHIHIEGQDSEDKEMGEYEDKRNSVREDNHSE